MSHNLNMNNGRASMCYVGQTPWQKLGQHVEGDGMTSQQVIMNAGLGFSVEKVPLFAAVTAASMVEVKRKYAVVRMDTNVPLGLVGEQYTPVQNTDGFLFFDAIVGAGEAVYQTAGALGNGETVWLLAKLPGTVGIPGDAVDAYVLLTLGHDGESAVTAQFVTTRVVCQNTFTLALKGRRHVVRIRHTRHANDSLKESHRLMGIVAVERQNTASLIEQLAMIGMSSNQNIKMTERLFEVEGASQEDVSTKTKNSMQRVMHHVYNGKGNDGTTAWSWLNGVAEWVDYERGGNSDDDDKAESALFGSGAALKRASLDILQAEYKLQLS